MAKKLEEKRVRPASIGGDDGARSCTASMGADAAGGIEVRQTYTAVVKGDGPWWIGWIEEVPGVNCQEGTRSELLESLRVTLSEALEMNREDARRAAGSGYEELPIAV